MRYDIVVFGNKYTTQYLLEHVHTTCAPVSLLVTVDDKAVNKDGIAGYSDLSGKAELLGIPVFKVTSYALQGEAERRFFSENQFGLGISTGWQRLIPKFVLDRFDDGVFGFHGSAAFLPANKGRSPMNWSILEGRKRFLNHLFKYNEQADDGQVHSVKFFEITPYDNIRFLSYKFLLTAKSQIKSLIEQYKAGSITCCPQSRNPESFYGKRTAADGLIDLSWPVEEIYNLIRAVTKPFPCAFLYLNGRKFSIIEAFPFDGFIDDAAYKIGEIIEIFDGDIIVKLSDGLMIFTRYDYAGVVERSDCFCSTADR